MMNDPLHLDGFSPYVNGEYEDLEAAIQNSCIGVRLKSVKLISFKSIEVKFARIGFKTFRTLSPFGILICDSREDTFNNVMSDLTKEVIRWFGDYSMYDAGKRFKEDPENYSKEIKRFHCYEEQSLFSTIVAKVFQNHPDYLAPLAEASNEIIEISNNEAVSREREASIRNNKGALTRSCRKLFKLGISSDEIYQMILEESSKFVVSSLDQNSISSFVFTVAKEEFNERISI